MPKKGGSRDETYPGDEDERSVHKKQTMTLEEEKAYLNIQELNDVPQSLNRYSLRASVFHFGQAGMWLELASECVVVTRCVC